MTSDERGSRHARGAVAGCHGQGPDALDPQGIRVEMRRVPFQKGPFMERSRMRALRLIHRFPERSACVPPYAPAWSNSKSQHPPAAATSLPRVQARSHNSGSRVQAMERAPSTYAALAPATPASQKPLNASMCECYARPHTWLPHQPAAPLLSSVDHTHSLAA